MVSGTISLPFRGTFHLSLTVLVHYRSIRVFSLGKWSSQLPTGFLVSRGTQESGGSRKDVAYGAVTRYGRPFQARSAIPSIAHFRMPVLQPHLRKRRWFGLLRVRSPLLAESFLFLGVLRCFSSPGSLHLAYVFSQR